MIVALRADFGEQDLFTVIVGWGACSGEQELCSACSFGEQELFTVSVPWARRSGYCDVWEPTFIHSETLYSILLHGWVV